MPRYVIAGAILLLVLLIGAIMLVVGGSNGANSNGQAPPDGPHRAPAQA